MPVPVSNVIPEFEEILRHHYRVRVASKGETGLSETQRHLLDQIILDLIFLSLQALLRNRIPKEQLQKLNEKC